MNTEKKKNKSQVNFVCRQITGEIKEIINDAEIFLWRVQKDTKSLIQVAGTANDINLDIQRGRGLLSQIKHKEILFGNISDISEEYSTQIVHKTIVTEKGWEWLFCKNIFLGKNIIAKVAGFSNRPIILNSFEIEKINNICRMLESFFSLLFESETLRDQNARLVLALQTLSDNMAPDSEMHDIKNNMIRIKHSMSLMIRGRERGLSSEVKKEIKGWLDAVLKSENLSVDYIKRRSAKGRRYQDVNVEKFIKNFVDNRKVQIAAQDIVLLEFFEDRHFWISADISSLERAIDNLVSNSVDALSSKKTQKKIIKISVESSPKGISINVRDNGIGIDPDLLKEVQLPGISTKGGTGMGLDYVARTARNHGGEFKLVSSWGRSTTAYLIIPAL